MSSARNIPTDDLKRELEFRDRHDKQQSCDHEFFVINVVSSGQSYFIKLECGYCGRREELSDSPNGRRLKLSINREELWQR